MTIEEFTDDEQHLIAEYELDGTAIQRIRDAQSEKEARRILEEWRIERGKLEKPTRYANEYLTLFPELVEFKSKTQEKRHGEIMGTLPPLAHNIMLSYFYLLDENNTLSPVEATWSEFLATLRNTIYLHPARGDYGGTDRERIMETLKAMHQRHFNIWRSGWVTCYTKSGKPKREKEAWHLYGVVLPEYKITYHLEPGQDEDLLTEEEKAALPIKGVRLKVAECLLYGLDRKGIGYSLGYHKRLMGLFHDFGKAWIPKLLTTWLLRQKSMTPEIGKLSLLEWCNLAEGRNRARNIKSLKAAIQRLKDEKVILEIEEDLPYKYGPNQHGDKKFDRYHKNPQWFPDWTKQIKE